MRVVIVHKTTRRSGRVTTRDEVLDVERVTIGRGTDNDVQLSGLVIELHHSVLRATAEGVHLQKLEAADLEVNGRRCAERLLRPKDRIRIGHFQLTVLPSQGNEDLRIELEAVSRRRSEMEELASRTVVGLSQGALTERKLAWLSVIGIPLVFAALPLMSGRLETFWDTGPVARAHSYFGDDCKQCHTGGFVRVADRQCLQCHADISNHTPPDVKVVDLESTRCATCHMEHNGEFELQRLEQELCAECHVDLAAKAPSTRVREVSDFGLDHPEFRLTVPTDALELEVLPRQGAREPREEWTRKLERLEWSPSLQESSGVKFNHVRHVGREEVKGSGGELLKCNDCHVVDEAGKNMKSIDFEEHCQECHSLSFDERFDDRQAFHGDTVEMRADLLEFYTAIELRAQEEEQGIRRQRVGGPQAEARRAAAMQTAKKMVDRASAFLMDEEKPGACANCHFVRPGAASDGGDDVAAVRLLDLWMPFSVFRHQTHEPFACRDCHPRASVYDPTAIASYESEKDLQPPDRPRPEWSYGKGLYVLYEPDELQRELGLEPSSVATDVLIPQIERCQGCHGGGHAKSPKVASECVLCHPFHRKEYDRMRPEESLPAARNLWNPWHPRNEWNLNLFDDRHGDGAGE